MSNNQSHNITIRQATEADGDALLRLAELDSARVPAHPVLVAHVNDELRAAVGTTDGAVIADPFHSTNELVAILRIEAGVAAEPAKSMSAYRRLWPRSPKPTGPKPSAPSVPGIPFLPGKTI